MLTNPRTLAVRVSSFKHLHYDFLPVYQQSVFIIQRAGCTWKDSSQESSCKKKKSQLDQSPVHPPPNLHRTKRIVVHAPSVSGRSRSGLISSNKSNVDEEPHGQFVKSLAVAYPKLPCRICAGALVVPCRPCGANGTLERGGYHKRNPVSLDRIIGSKWTAMERTFGWRHFFVHSKVKGQGKEWFLEMVATCDATSRFWVNAQNLKDRERWSMGWLQKEAISSLGGVVCKACMGAGQVVCSACAEVEASTTGGPSPGKLDVIQV